MKNVSDMNKNELTKLAKAWFTRCIRQSINTKRSQDDSLLVESFKDFLSSRGYYNTASLHSVLQKIDYWEYLMEPWSDDEK